MPQANGIVSAPVSGNGTALASQGVNVQDNQTYAGATYDFGILKAYAGYITRQATSTADSADSIERQAAQIGVRGSITPAIEGWASAGLGRYKAGSSIANSTAAIPTANFSGFQLGTNYWLSKRTNLYAMYGQTKTDNGSASVGGATTSGDANNYAVGMRHTF
jgi:predicted porin